MLTDINLAALQFNKASAANIDLICEPLFSAFGIVHFAYIRVLPGKKMFRIANNAAWSEKFFEHQFYNDLHLYGINLQKVPVNGTARFILAGKPESKHCNLLCNEFNMWNFLLIYEKFEDYSNFWCFGADRDNSEILNLYLNNVNLFKKFVVYFKEKYLDNLTYVDKKFFITTEIDMFQYEYVIEENLKKFFNDTQVRKYYFKSDNKEYSLSRRETECLSYLSKGMGIKEIASIMNVSPRTIESYVIHIKDKTNCYNKNDVLKLATINSFMLL